MITLDNEKDPRSRLEIVEKLSDENSLVEIACTDDSPRVRLLAISRIRDDDRLLKVANDANELDVRLLAVERISSQEKIAEILRAKENLDLLGMCFSKITDRNIIESIAEDTTCNPVARRLAVEHFANEAYLAEVYEEKTGRKSPRAIDAFLDYYGGGLRGVRAIGRFKRSPKALKALGTIAKRGGEEGDLAVEYLSNALGSSNQDLVKIATEELAGIEDPELVATLVRALENPKLAEPIRGVLARIDTPESRVALETANR
ncbi:MAG: hypothetical protein GY854_18075 [Deltaproteobacteria bacterium]|nr:hypothetical protein [Deltaproteobacteria bacterium]